ncbi:MAG: ATP-binding cassette domain-containing protein, partial [Acidobacteriota bacterium]|nr:ATP-binding cassette domain-containing protein [Acidobacteriota bacterium]
MELDVDIRKQMKNFRLEVSFSAGQKTLGVLGPSGSGKSMTLRCIAGLETPDEGRISLNCSPLFDSARGINLPSRKRRVGFMLQ